jgi:glyoxylase-like metal-dependent hydrolase (beta-lactamase superfamily II)
MTYFGRALVFDPFMVPEAAADLKKAAEQLTGKRVQYVVNSHRHIDHVGGNAVFADAEIISTATTQQTMAGHIQHELGAMKNWLPPALLNLTQKDTTFMSRFEADEHRMWKAYYSAL